MDAIADANSDFEGASLPLTSIIYSGFWSSRVTSSITTSVWPRGGLWSFLLRGTLFALFYSKK